MEDQSDSVKPLLSATSIKSQGSCQEAKWMLGGQVSDNHLETTKNTEIRLQRCCRMIKSCFKHCAQQKKQQRVNRPDPSAVRT